MGAHELMEELQKIDMIPIDRTSPGAADRQTIKVITGRQYRRMLRRWAFAFGVSLAFNIVLAVALWFAQAGPI